MVKGGLFMGKFYAVKKGKNPGIYRSWDECSKQVIGYNGAIYKSFFNMDEAIDFLGECKENTSIDDNSDKAIAYVDGSYNANTGEFSYGAIIFYNNNEYQFNKKFDDISMSSMRNVAGEIEGAKKAISFCIENKIPEVYIYYDYRGIEAWANGEWKATKEGTIRYKNYCDLARKKIKINFVKVKAHSNNKYNDIADKLAKLALK